MKCLKQCCVIISALLINSLIFPSFGNAQSRSDFPNNDNLRQRNVALTMVGFKFSSGIDEEGRRNWQGFGIVGLKKTYTRGGSGFIVGTDGTIVTNYHVATKALYGIAKFDDGSTYEIKKIKAYDPYNDIAFLKMEGTKIFPRVILGNSDTLKPLDQVLAVGNPGGRGINMTEGAVSQVPKDDYGRIEAIIHTATIAPGSSGGALYFRKKVVGVNSSVFLGSWGGPTGFYNAIPINKVKNLLNDPRNDHIFLLNRVFPPDPQTLMRNYRTLSTGNGRVPAARSSKIPGVFSFKDIILKQLEDYLILVDSPGRDLALVVTANNRIIGCGDIRKAGIEGILISNIYPKKVKISVLNLDATPANFGLTVGVILWGQKQ